MSESSPSGEHELQSTLISPEVRMQISRIAVLHPTRSQWQGLERKPTDISFYNHSTEKESSFQIAESADNPATLEISMFDDTEEKSNKLHAMQSVVYNEVRKEAQQGREIDWKTIALKLLDAADEADEKEAHIVGAVVCSLFAPEAQDRIDFLKAVYERGIQEDVAAACDYSPIVLLREGPQAPYQNPETAYAATNIQSLGHCTDAFRQEEARVGKYLAFLESYAVDDSRPSAKSIQKKIVKDGSSSEPDLTEQAADVSLNWEKVTGAFIDPTKIERFAIQQVFIGEQMHEVLGPDLRDTPLSHKLVELRSHSETSEETPEEISEDVDGKVTPKILTLKLQEDVGNAIKELSAPVIEKFKIHDDIQSPLTKEQEANKRFHELVKEIKANAAVARFIDLDLYNKSILKESIATIIDGETEEVWSNSESGAAAPDVVTATIENVVQGALNNPALGEVSEEELYEFCQSQRRYLLTIATRNIRELTPGENFISASILLERDNEKKLKLKNRVPLVEKNKLDEYAAVTLGCPALHEVHGDRATLEQEEKLTLGSSNYIDHILATTINEAYERGIFNLSQYTLTEAA